MRGKVKKMCRFLCWPFLIYSGITLFGMGNGFPSTPYEAGAVILALVSLVIGSYFFEYGHKGIYFDNNGKEVKTK